MLRSVPVESPMFIVLKGCGQIAGLKSVAGSGSDGLLQVTLVLLIMLDIL